MDELQKLYDLLYEKGYFTQGYEVFKEKIKDPTYQDKVYGVLTRDRLYTKPKTDFTKQYLSAASIAPQAVVAEQEPSKKKVTTVLPSAGGLSDLSKIEPQRAVAESTATKQLMPMPVVKKQAPVIEGKDEVDYFQGGFGDVLRKIDEYSPIGIGDFIDDMARSVAQGYRQGTAAEEADKLLLKGTKATPEQIQKFINARKDLAALAPSKEMRDYQKIYEQEGKGFWGVVKGLATNPTVFAELITSSLTAMATNSDALLAGATAIGTGASIGAATGAGGGTAVVPGLGTVVGGAAGAYTGAVASLPYAFGLASSVVEAGSTFGELLEEELGGKEMTKENVRQILEDPNKLSSIRNKAIARGLIIGTVDALTAKLASGVGAKVIEKGVAKTTTGAVTKSTLTKATGAGAAVEAVGGSVGEATARLAIGQEMDVSEITLEGIAELPGGIRSTIQSRLAKPTFKVNGEKVDANQVDELINTMTPDQLVKTKIDITNDFEGRKLKIQDKIVTGQIKKEVQQANPNADETTINQLVELEKELKKFEENKTQSGKDRAAAIRSQIKTIQQDAVQKQAAGEVPVQPTPGVSEKVEEGKPQTEPQVTTEEGQEKINDIERRRQEELDRYEGRRANSLVKYNRDGENTELTESEIEEAEMIINSAKERGLDVDRTQKLLQTNGFVQSVSNSPTAFREFLKARLSGEIDNKVNGEFLNTINAKYDAELKALEQAEPQGVTEEGVPQEKVKPVDFSTQLEQKYGVQVDLLGSLDKGNLSLSRIVIPEGQRGTGIGTQVMEDIVNYADENKVKVTLTPSIDFGGESVERLTDFYKRFGFVENKGDNKDFTIKDTMYREPQVSSKTRVNIAPFFDTQIGSTVEAAALRESPAYKSYLQTLADIGNLLGIKTNVFEFIGGYENKKGDRIVEISNAVELEGATIEQAEEYAALVSAFAPQVQEAAIAVQYTEQDGKNHNANEYSVKVSDVDGAIDALKEAGITDFSINEKTGEVSFIDVLDFADPQLQKNIGTFVELLKSKGINYEQQDFRPVDSRRVGIASRKKILGRIKAKGSELGPSGQNILQTVEDAVRRDAEFQGIDSGEYFKPSPGNRLFNKPLERVAQIADRYYQRVFGKKRPRYKGSQSLDEARAKRIANAFAAMQHNPTDPQVRAAYEAMAEETLDQYQDFLDAGYVVEINNEEPYANSQEMIDDLRNNQRMKIFSTESGFGDAAITEEQRAENPLLRDSGFKDVNGQTMLVNDVFRAIHDFFGHAELGNSFGPKGEENAWNVHARMYSPLARAAMTTETRGQNSYVNFSGENDAIKELRQQARDLREEGLYSQARKIEEQIYEKFKFADQKIGLLPAEFYEIDETDTGDMAPAVEEDLMTADTKDATTLEKVKDFLDKLDNDLTKFGRETAGINIAIPVMKAIIKTVKALVSTGITLQEAISRAAAQNNVSEQDVIDSINAIANQRAMQAQPEGTTEMELPGFNRMMTELEGVVRKSLQRGNTNEEAMQNAIAYLQGSRVYETASDTQREKMVRDIRKRFGKREKAAPKPQKLFGETKDVNEITMSEYELLKKQLADKAKGAKDAIKLWVQTSAELVKYLKTMADKGFITAKQTAAIVSKFSGVNMFDPNSISRFVDYMAKVFKNANYVEQIGKIRSMLPSAKKNVGKKLGVSESLVPMLNQLFAINPTLIPDAVFDKYVGLVEMMGQRKAVIELKEYGKILETTEEILDAVAEESLKVETLAEIFNEYDNKVVDDEGKINFAETIKRMVESNKISQEDSDIMRKYKSAIIPKEAPVKKTNEELAEEKKVLIKAIRDSSIDFDGLPLKDQRDKSRELNKLVKTDGIKGLDNAQLNNLLRVIDNINNGYFPHYAQLMVEKINGINRGKATAETMQSAKPFPASLIYSKIKAKLTKKDGMTELVRREPLFYIDQVYGDFKTKQIFNNIFEAPADAVSRYDKEISDLKSKLDEAEEKVFKSFKYNGNETQKSKFRMMTYLLQLEYNSNPGNPKVNSAAKFLEKTIDHINSAKTSFGERDAEFLQEILDKFGETVGKDKDGKEIIEINNEKLYRSFNSAEKNAIKVVQGINEDIRDKAIYTASTIRGDKISPLANYVHHNVLHEFRPEETASGPAFVDEYSASLKPSTRAKSLISRTGELSALNFDVFSSASRGARYIYMDYYLTEPIRTSRKALAEARKVLKKEKATKKQRDILNSIDNAFEEATKNMLTNNFVSTSITEDAINFIAKQGYRTVLASLPRFAAELSSNVGMAVIAAPQDFKKGASYRDIILSADAPNIMFNVKSKLTKRIYPHNTMSGRMIDPSVLSQASGLRGSRAKSDVANKINQIYNMSFKKYQNVVELTADSIMSSPDKMVMQPIWFGAFANEFKKVSGKEIDLEKIGSNDEKYMSANEESIEKARIYADEKAVLIGASDNAYMGILKGTPKANQSGFIRAFNLFNNFMTHFLMYEYSAARTGIMAAIGNSSISKKQGAAILAGVATRMTLYTLLMQLLSQGFVNLFVDDEEEDDEKTLMQKIGQAISSSATSLFLGRNFGNATKSVVNQGVEYMNQKYLDFLRNGDYDPYKDAIQYTIIPSERKGSRSVTEEMIMNMMGPFGPSFKTLDFAIRKATEPEKKESAARKLVDKEKQIRLPLEILGNLGMIPLYKDVRKIVNAELYKDLENAEVKKPMNKIGKEDMKRYFPDMYEDLYGPNGSLYDIEEMKKELRKEKERIRREIKDDLYNYVPKQSGGNTVYGKEKKSK